MKRIPLTLLLATALAAPVAGNAGEGGTANGEAAAEVDLEREEPRFLTGLGFSYRASAGTTALGPGLTWGLVLLPERLDLMVGIGALMGDGVYSVPVNIRFEVPWRITGWMELYMATGPTMLFDRFDGTWHHDFAFSASGGMAVSPAGYQWAMRLSGDYDIRFWRELSHLGGFTIGFLYGF